MKQIIINEKHVNILLEFILAPKVKVMVSEGSTNLQIKIHKLIRTLNINWDLEQVREIIGILEEKFNLMYKEFLGGEIYLSPFFDERGPVNIWRGKVDIDLKFIDPKKHKTLLPL